MRDGLFGAVRERRLFVQSVLIFAHGMLSKGLGEFSDRHPEIALKLSTGNLPVDFTHDYNDLSIVFGNPLAYGRQGEELMGETLFPVARPAVAAAIDRPEDLLEHRLIEVATHRAGWAHFFDRLGVNPVGARYLFVDNTLIAAALAAEGQGIAMARAPASDKITTESGLVPCLPEISVPGAEAYHLVYEDRASLRPPARAFRDWLLDWVGRRKA
jgi:LysR family glycine cleavage system transcriptional activator